jgi:hypothetical protein
MLKFSPEDISTIIHALDVTANGMDYEAYRQADKVYAAELQRLAEKAREVKQTIVAEAT